MKPDALTIRNLLIYRWRVKHAVHIVHLWVIDISR